MGQTSRDPDWRVHQPRVGYKVSGAVRRFGVRLLFGPVEHLNQMRRWEALEIKAALAVAFRNGGGLGRVRSLILGSLRRHSCAEITPA